MPRKAGEYRGIAIAMATWCGHAGPGHAFTVCVGRPSALAAGFSVGLKQSGPFRLFANKVTHSKAASLVMRTEPAALPFPPYDAVLGSASSGVVDRGAS